MSTCSATTTSNGFSLDWNAPFTFLDGNIFALLDCSTSSSPLYSSNTTPPMHPSAAFSTPARPLASSTSPSRRAASTRRSASAHHLRWISTSSSAAPTPGFIASMAPIETNSSGWKFGIALKYRFSVDDGYPSACADCEKSNGVCGYTGQYNSFTCNCGNGLNTSTNCYYASASWNGGSRTTVPLWINGIGLISSWWLIVAWIL